jgi:hypothetical protein
LACSDKPIISVYDKSILDGGVECMRLVVFPPNKTIEETLQKEYSFDDGCDIKLMIATKGKIHCNSNQNSQTKAMGKMPDAYLRMDVLKGNKTLYSYYIDIKDEIKPLHVEDAFKRVSKDLKVKR